MHNPKAICLIEFVKQRLQIFSTDDINSSIYKWSQQIKMIINDKQLCDFLHNIKDETELAIDTEFKRINTYYPILCLVQIATKSATDCIDVLAIKNLQPLFDKLYQTDCLWIVHSAVYNHFNLLRPFVNT
jgi:hypothetical protein